MFVNTDDLKFRAADWVRTTYGADSLMDRKNRAARVFEEACELLQAEGGDLVLAQAIVARCYSRPLGEPLQEAAGVQFTLLMHAWAAQYDPLLECERELQRVLAMPAAHFRAKQKEKFDAGTDLALPLVQR